MGEEYGISRLEHRNEELDYAILRLKERPSLSASQWGYLRLARNDEPMTTQTSLIIFQHPLGKNNEYAIGNFVQKEAQTNIFYHDAVTHQGSSGAPIINKGTLNVIGIHQGENQDQKLRQGRLISSILDDLKIHKPDLYEKIIDSQNNWRS